MFRRLAFAMAALGILPFLESPAPQDRIDALEKRLTALEKSFATAQTRADALAKEVDRLRDEDSALGQQVKAHGDLLARVFEWFRALDTACAKLRDSVEFARENGFEYAGPNPKAKKAVLDALNGFAAALSAPNPVKPKPKDSARER